MKRAALAAVLGFSSMLFLAGCTGDTGPAGPSGTAECAQCHLDQEQLAEIVANKAMWEQSVHATGGHYVRNGDPCLNCHTNEGFQGIDASDPSPIGCFTCHDPHTNFDFSLRKRDPVALNVGGAVFDMGEANLCANCHQARPLSKELSEFPTTPGSPYWGPHHGPQSNILAGSGAYDFGEGAYGSHAFHPNAPDGCIQCHMATPEAGSGGGGVAGGHTWKMEYEYHSATEDLVEGCNVSGCHGSDPLTDFDHDGLQTDISTMLDEIQTLAINLGLITSSNRTLSDRVYTKEEIGVVLNYLFLEEDRSLGVHNPTYAKQVAERTLAHAHALAGS